LTVDKRLSLSGLWNDRSLQIRLAVLAGVVLGFTLILYPRILVPRQLYRLGDVAQKDVKAPRELLVRDPAATELKRRQAVQEVLTVYDHDTEMAARLARTLDEAFADLRDSRRAFSEQRAFAHSTVLDYDPSIEEARLAFEAKIGIRVSQGAFAALEAEGFSKRIAEGIGDLLQKLLDNGVVATKENLLKDLERGVVLKDVRTLEDKVVFDFKQFYSLDQARSLVRGIGQSVLRDFDYAIANLVVDFCQRLIQPNITLNRSETEQRKLREAAEVKPVLFTIKPGEILLREGEQVSELHLLKLQALESEGRPETFLPSVAGTAALMAVLFVVSHILFFSRSLPANENPTRGIILMASVFLFFQLAAQGMVGLLATAIGSSHYSIPPKSAVYLVPLAAAPMIVCVFLKLPASLPFGVVLAMGTAVLFENSLAVCIFFMITGCMGAYWIRNCRERKVFVTAGAKTGLLGAVIAVAVEIFSGHLSWTGWAWSGAFAFLGGVGAGLSASGVVPLVEIAFGYTTDISLLELANLDRPILRRLMIEAPGSYHHSVILGAMAEAAAAEIGANPLLAKVTGYYHDIGKIRKPQYFIENQRDGKNKHDRLAPSMSSLILISHIKEGVEIAREHKLGPVIIDGIRQHHGTSLIRYFYEKARQLKGEDQVKEEDFRYPGPKPQTREAALVMLADVVEAASRTLENPTPARIKGMVQSLFNRILSDGQLEECDLTLKDLNRIAGCFNTILNGIHHHRIEYFDQRSVAAENGRSKPRNGHPDRQPSKTPTDLIEPDAAKRPDPPKLLRAS
jgi:putative nucleotidyltransferase with HDIG domain